MIVTEIGDNVTIGDSTVIQECCHIFRDVQIGNLVFIGRDVIIQEDCRIRDRVRLDPDTYLGAGVEIGRDAVIHAGCDIMDNAVIGAGVRLAPRSVIAPGQKVLHDTLVLTGGVYPATLSDSGIRIGCQGPFWPDEWLAMDLEKFCAENYKESVDAVCQIWYNLFEFYWE